MKIALTGASGGIGRYVCEWLAREHEVIGLDRESFGSSTFPGAELKQADILDAESLPALLDGTEAVVHLAAIPNPFNHPGRTIIEANVIGSWNVMDAAVHAGCRRFINTSSDCTVGVVFASQRRTHDYLPVDETHPLRPEDPYGFSKVCTEEATRVFKRRSGIETVSARPCWVFTEEMCKYHEGILKESRTCSPNLWAFIDPRDLAEAYRLMLEADSLEHDVYYLAADTTLQTLPTCELLERHFPEVPIKPYGDGRAISGRSGLIDCTRMKKEFGWQPQYDWPAWSKVPHPD